MVHVIVLSGPAAAVKLAEARIEVAADGWIEVRDGTWIVGGVLDAQQWREHLGVPGLRILVARLSGSWATKSMSDISSWLKGARHGF